MSQKDDGYEPIKWIRGESNVKWLIRGGSYSDGCMCYELLSNEQLADLPTKAFLAAESYRDENINYRVWELRPAKMSTFRKELDISRKRKRIANARMRAKKLKLLIAKAQAELGEVENEK